MMAPLRWLRLGPTNHPTHHNVGRVDIQRRLDLLVLRLRRTGLAILAGDLLSAGLKFRTSLVSIHVLVDAATPLRVRQHSCHLSVVLSRRVLLNRPELQDT
jgi:hypothetical protein